jgi:hypothetical protein
VDVDLQDANIWFRADKYEICYLHVSGRFCIFCVNQNSGIAKIHGDLDQDSFFL